MRLAGVFALVLLLADRQPETQGIERAQGPGDPEGATEQVSSPPARDFGPDTYRTGAFTGDGITRSGLRCGASSAHGRICNGFFPSAVDGTLLDVSVMVPHGTGLHPLVALLHGWGGSKSSSGDLADALLAEGYAVLRYSARGFGRSWGQVNVSDVHVEIEDLRSMLGSVVDHRALRIDPDAIAITGASYGGGQSWLALLRPTFATPRGATIRIRTVVPIVPWSDLLYSLIPNGRPEQAIQPPGSPKLSYINAFYVSGLRDSPDRPYPNYPDYLIAWHAWINGMEPNELDPVYRQIVDGIAAYRSIWWRPEFWRDAAQNRVPVFQVQGMTDDLFPLAEAKRMLLALKIADPLYPISSYFGDLGHPRASNKPAEVEYVLGLVRDWLSYYLRGVGSEPAHVVRAAITRPRDRAFTPVDVITVPTYDTLASRIITKHFGESATLVNPAGDPYSGFYWDPLVMEASRELKPHPLPPPDAAVVPGSIAVYTVAVSALTGGSSLVIAGQPMVLLRAATVGPRVQLNARLFDVAPDGARQLITRGTYMLESDHRDNAPAAIDAIIPTFGNVWEAAPDHLLHLEITNVDSPYVTPSRIPSVTQISDVRLDLPVR